MQRQRELCELYPVWLSNFNACTRCALAQVVSIVVVHFSRLIEVEAEMDHLPHEAQNIDIVWQRPNRTSCFVILQYALLFRAGAAHFIAMSNIGVQRRAE